MTNFNVTARKRAKFPARYVRKDARTQILREVYIDAGNNRSNQLPVIPKVFKSASDKNEAAIRIRRLMKVAAWPEWKSEGIMADFRKCPVDTGENIHETEANSVN